MRENFPLPNVPWVLSNPSKGSLLGFANDLQAYLRSEPPVDVGAVGFTLANDRQQLGHRAVLAGQSPDDFLHALEALELGTPAPSVIEGLAERPEDVVLVFPPQGPEWVGMGCELLDTSEAFGRHIHDCEDALDPFVEWSLIDVLRGADGAPGFDRGDVAQPAVFAITVSLARLLRAHGLEPAAVLGHSLGEIAAAHIADGLSLDDAARVVALWSQAQETLRGSGGMASVQLPPEELSAYLGRWSAHLNIAAHNGPGVVIVSGDNGPLDELLGELQSDGVRAQRISVPFAAHSPHIDAIRDRLLSDLAPIAPRSGSLPFYSSHTGGRLDTADLDAAYWARALREVVRFDESTRAVLAAGHRVLLEVSPHPVLTFGMRQTVDAFGDGVVLSSLRRERAGLERVAAAMGEAWVQGAEVDWTAAFGDGEHQALELPRSGASIASDERETLRGRLRAAPAGERGALALGIVRSQVATALGYSSPDDVSPGRPFKELGLDSASVVELAAGLNRLLELRLPPTVGFDHPTAAGLTERLLAEVLGVAPKVVRVEPPAAAVALDEPIAIVGTGCRFPGEVGSSADLWRLVDSGGDAIGAFPTDRGWDLDRLYDPDPDRVGTCYVRTGGFVYDAPEFDAELFGISPREALAMDPQQRILLQVAWEALEDAGIDPLSLRGSDTSVFAGVFPQEYGPRLQEADVTAGYALTGSLTSVVSGRVAYSLGLEGQAVTVDTACSSSLVALHHACAALRQGECSLALAGGVTVLSTPGLFVEFSRQRGLAIDGRCKSFGAAADGTGFADGAGLLVVERLSDARRLGHHVLALVRGSAVNQDGASNGLTAPNGPSQERVIRQALANARLSPADVDVVEAHGTGTTLGDPIEAQALIATYGQERSNGPLHLGSLKSNIGHTNAAAGVAGVIKMVEAMRHERLPRSLHCEEPSPHVDWSAGDVELLREAVEWPAGERSRRAGVSSFGISGTNAHVILEEPPVETSSSEERPVVGALPFVVSAAGDEALATQAGRLAAFLESRPEGGLFEVGCALARRRARLDHRAVVVAADRGALVAGLRAIERDEPAAGVARDVASDAGGVAFLFSGQGSQWPGMGAELCRELPVFAEALDAVCDELDRYLERPLLEVMFAADGSAEAELLADTRYTQVALFALEVALYRLVESFGLAPDYLIGHSVGEFAAAYAAGVFSLADGCRLVAERARLMGALPAGGGMLAVEASEDEALESLAGFENRVALAAVNGPRAVVVSGDAEAIAELEGLWRGRERRVTRLRVSHAFHSQLMEPMLDELRAVAAQIELSEPSIAIVSNLTGERLSGEQARSPDYWVRHVRETVRFADGVRHLERAGVTRFLELGPDAVLSAIAAQATADGDEREPLFATSLRGPSAPQREALLAFLAAAHCHGLDVDWSALLDDRDVGRVELPTYAFQRRRYWLEAAPGANGLAAAGLTTVEHPLLSTGLPLGGADEWLFTGRISLTTHPWLADHAAMGVVLLPGTAFVELALAAARDVGAAELEDLTLVAPLVLDAQAAVQVQVAIAEPDDDQRRPVDIYSRPDVGAGGDPDDAGWTLHASGLLAAGAASAGDDEGLEAFAAASWPPEGAEELDVEPFYERLSDAGYDYGPAFRALRRAFRAGDEWYAEIALDDEHEGQAASFRAHPALADAALHTMLLATLDSREPDDPPEVPFAFSGVRVRREGCSSLRVRVEEAQDAEETGARTVRVLALDESGAPALTIEALKLRPIDQAALKARTRAGQGSLLAVEWVALEAGAASDSSLRAALLGGDDGDGMDLDAAGIAFERYPDVEALEEVVASGAPVPDVVLARVTTAGDGLAASVHDVTERTLELLQAWLRSEPLAEARLALLTDGALPVSAGESPNLGQAALPGLVRSAVSENPGRFALIDLDRSEDSAAALTEALGSDEPEVAIRVGRVLAPRLARAAVEDQGATQTPDPSGTILITGGTHGLGALVARHLAADHGARRLLLTSRSGAAAEGAGELVASLAELGCEAQVAACDVADRAQLEALLGAVPEEHALTAVVHAAGVADDGVIASLDGDRLRNAMAPKVDGALNLHELTADLGLSQFILFSSAAATIGAPGQGNYAAANAFLDALAHHRHAQGLPATALAWGAWERATAMTGGNDVDLARWERAGIAALSDEHGLALLDTARAATGPLLVPVRLETGALRTRAKAGTLPAILRGLFHAANGQAAAPRGSLARSLADAPESERQTIVLELVVSHVASVLGHASDEAIDPQRAFKDLGFDSLSAVELRNRLSQATGLKLPATLIFDHASPAAVAELLRSKVAGTGQSAQATRRSRSRTDEPIAIVGMSARYPGGVRSPDELWELVLSGTDAIGEFPDDRGWDLEHLYDPDPDHPGTSYTRHGGFVYDAGEFDPEFFSISPREALAIDPQHRLLLEGTWQALEDAEIDPSRLRGTQTGVFAGVMYQDYGSTGMPAELEGYIGTGGSLLSGRLAYTFGFEGPAVSIDTACSSSLVTLHLACQALRQGECELALAGGVTVLSTPTSFVQFSRQRALSPDGRCKAFGADADGTAWSEGAGLLVLERLSDARANGHRVLALVRGSAVNQDGASNGLTAPNGPSQERVIRQALATAGLSASDVDVVEAHGTGTALGDPIEAQALLATYGQDRPAGPLYVGSIKSNIGHTQAAAGVAGVIKMVEAMRHGLLPRSLYCEQPSPHVDWSAGDVELLAWPVDWSPGERVRRAAVSSFGVSGTNAHVILEEPPAGVEEVPERSIELPSVPVVVSGHGEDGLRAQAGRLRDWLVERPELLPVDVGFSSATVRAQLERRAVVLASDRGELIARLGGLASGDSVAGVVTGSAGVGKTAFLFSGQGAQWPGMGVGLYRDFPVFARALDAVCAELDPTLGRSLMELMFAVEGSVEAELLDRTEFTQPALFAIEVGLFRLLESWGVRPDLLVGHSVGELVAAHVAGVLSLSDACALVVARGRLMGALPVGGAMVAIEASEEEVEQTLADIAVSVAAVNGLRSVVVSGEAGPVAELQALWAERGRKTSRLSVSHAFHSSLMEPMLDEFRAVAAGLSFEAPRIPIVSNVTGNVVSDELRDPDYWVRHVREPVRFADGVRELERLGATRYLELGPDAVLTPMAQGCLDDDVAGRGVFVSAMRKDRDQSQTLIASLGALHTHGATIDWQAFYEGTGARHVVLPTYAFQRERYWLAPAASGPGDLAAAGLGTVDHPLLSAMMPLPGDRGAVFSGRVSLATQPWLRDHAVFDRVVFPATAFAELALVAGGELRCGAVEELTLEAPLVLADDDEATIEVVVGDDRGGGRREVEVFSRRGKAASGAAGDAEAADWVRHASGVVSEELSPPAGAVIALAGEVWPPPGADPVDVVAMYDRLADAGFGYGPAFQGVVAAWRRGDETFCEVAVGDDQDAAGFAAQPALLDASFHAMLDGLHPVAGGASVPLPFALSGVRVHRAGASSLRVVVTTADGETAFSLAAVDETGQPALEIDSLAMRPVDAARLGAAARTGGDALFRHEWVELPLDGTADRSERYALLGEGLGLPPDAPRYGDLDAFVEAIEQGADVPDVVFVALPGIVPPALGDEAAAAAAHDGVTALLSFLQAWLRTDAAGESRLVLVTRGAMGVTDGEPPDPARAALWGLVRSAQSEHPGRFTLVDLGEIEQAAEIDWPGLLAADEPQLAVRRGTVYALRLARLEGRNALVAPAGAWHLDAPSRGTLESLALVEGPRARDTLGPDEVRISVRAGGLNFRDVLIALGQYPDDDPIGSEGAGVVLEVGGAVTDLAPGDRVMGLMPEALGPVAVTEGRLVARVPKGWSYAEAASVPVVFLSAYYGLLELADLREGETLLVHAGAGGVGIAAIQLARHVGAEIYATASPEKWDVLRELGLDDDHIASSRDLEFRDRFLAGTRGEGVDVVLSALAGEAVDASLDLLPRGGRFLDLGKADRRDADQVRRERPGVEYRAFDLMRDAGPDRVAAMLAEVLALFETGVLRRLPIRAWDVRRAFEAFRHLGDGRNVGKVVLTVPRPLDPDGTVLITGGTGDLGARVARHLAGEHRVHRLLLVSRRGGDAPGAAELIEQLRELGADPRVAACDVADREDLSALLGSIDAEHPLTAVIHTAGVLDDGVIESLTPEQVDRVLGPKVDAALLLHELTLDIDLAELVLFSSDSGTLGVPGQGNYAAANAFLDALAELRQARGLPGRALAWGLWSNATGIAGDLGDVDIARLGRLGVVAMSNELELFDAAREAAEPVVVPTRLDMPALRASAQAGTLPPLMRDVVRARAQRVRKTAVSLGQQLAGLPEGDREDAVVGVVCAQAAVVLGYGSAEAIDPERKFKELGFDSLGGVELRNRLAEVSGLRLPSTLVFDHPSPVATARYLLSALAPPPVPAPAPGADETEIQRRIASITVDQLRAAGLLDPLLSIAGTNGHAAEAPEPGRHGDLDDLDADELVRMVRAT